MNESIIAENNSVESEKPVQLPPEYNIQFPPFPDPSDKDFEEDITEDERTHYKIKFRDLNAVTSYRIHCTACDRHLGCSARTETRIRPHPLLRTLMCHTCHTFYNSGEFEKGDDGSELYCRWCGQGGQVYCCSACPHVFCAKCIKRNLGLTTIKEIEDTDDWKCFKCNTKYLWDLRALCWAVVRYCDLKSRIASATQDAALKELYLKHCQLDLTICCKSKQKKKNEEKRVKQKEDCKKITNTIAKLPSTIQVKKFASINLDETIIRHDKKPQKRPASPKNKPIIIKNPLANKILSPVIMPPMAKKMRMNSPSIINPVRFSNDRRSLNSNTRIRPQPSVQQMVYNGFSNNVPFNHMVINDNINLTLESLTQGLDMATVAGISNNVQDNDVVCTPDFPLEPLCEVTEDTNDDDVECIGPVVTPKPTPPQQAPAPPPPLIPRNVNQLPSLTPDNIIQMTEHDVTVNAVTGGLKFRVDPQTLSSNKMYRLPDGRIFAINANPNMPGGYSATIVAVTDEAMSKMPPKGATYAAKLSTVGNQMVTPLKDIRNQNNNRNKSKRNTPKTNKSNKRTETPTREFDLNVPVEWFRYNVIDAVDALEYSLSRLNKLKQESTTMFLRTRSVSEMRNLHKRLERLLNTSTCRFNEIRENINKELKQYILKKMGGDISDDDDDDDVEILHDDNDDPIFIDENSVESNANESQEVDLTGVGSSDHNDSSEKSMDKNDSVQILEPLCIMGHKDSYNDDRSILPDKVVHDGPSEKLDEDESILPDNSNILQETESEISEKQSIDTNDLDSTNSDDRKEANGETDTNDAMLVSDDSKNSYSNNISKDREIGATKEVSKDSEILISDINGEERDNINTDRQRDNSVESKKDDDILKDDSAGQYHSEKKTDDPEMSEEMIESLLKDEPEDNIEKENLTAVDISV